MDLSDNLFLNPYSPSTLESAFYLLQLGRHLERWQTLFQEMYHLDSF